MSGDEKHGYVIAHLALGGHQSIDTTKEQYEGLLSADVTRTRVTSLEEKLFAICEHYREIEEFIFSATLNHMIYGFTDVPKIHSVSTQFARLMGSFLSAVRLYLDSVVTDTKALTNGDVDKSEVKAIISSMYDSSFCYRVMEAIRNHSQHRAFPVHSASYPNNWDKGFTTMSCGSEFYFETSEVNDDKQFNKAVKKEIEEHGGKVDLKLCVRTYFGCICDIHAGIRILIKPYREAALGKFSQARKSWNSAFDDNKFSAVAACRFEGGLLDKEFKKVHLDTQIDEYRESLELRTAHLQNMSKRRVVW